MSRNVLSYKQNLCSARVFLNMFGLVLDEVSEIDENTKINIYLKDTDIVVGELYFSDNNVIIKVAFNNDSLEANYEMVTTNGGVDHESFDAAYNNWRTNIIFEMKTNKGDFSGEVLIVNGIDSQFGISCHCHTLLNGRFADRNIALKFQRDGAAFQADIWNDLNNERFLIAPFDKMNGFLRHTVNVGKYKKPGKEWDSYKSSSFISVASGDYDDMKGHLRAFLKEAQDDKTVNFQRFFLPIEMVNGKASLQQKGYTMQSLDKTFTGRIDGIRNLLAFGNTSFINGCINTCFDTWSDAEVKSIFGIDRTNGFYQDGSTDLLTAYFNPGGVNPFGLEESQLKLLKGKQ